MLTCSSSIQTYYRREDAEHEASVLVHLEEKNCRHIVHLIRRGGDLVNYIQGAEAGSLESTFHIVPLTDDNVLELFVFFSLEIFKLTLFFSSDKLIILYLLIGFLQLLTIFVVILEAIKDLEKVGYGHFDITTKNIFLTKEGYILLGDFGIASLGKGDHHRGCSFLLRDRNERVVGKTDILLLYRTMLRLCGMSVQITCKHS